VVDKFIFSFTEELLSPIIMQTVVLLLPTYLALMLSSAEKSQKQLLRRIGVTPMRAEHVFFTIFAALFMMCASLVLSMLFGGAVSASRGFTLLGTLTAGINEYTVSPAYLILAYVIFPAIIEEVVFRGFIFGELSKINVPLAAIASSLIYALFSFSFGGFIPALFCGLMLVFVMRTTRSLIACMAVHLAFNLYGLFLQTNICAYFLSAQNTVLLIIVVAIALLISALLFFSEAAKVYRTRAQRIADGVERSRSVKLSIRQLWNDLIGVFAYKPTLICTVVSLAICLAITVINIVI
jgi:membrane protease YdiL (CAAX protease family)